MNTDDPASPNSTPDREAWEAGKAEHLQLCEAAAPLYDAHYANDNGATGEYMRYEEAVLLSAIAIAPVPRLLAGEIGCGTGRESGRLARFFKQIDGFDLSPHMVEQAQRRKLQENLGNVLFRVHDAENGPLPWISGSVSLVTSAFGMGSFVREPEAMFRETRRVLMPGGVALFSFYNAAPLLSQVALPWNPGLAARLVDGGVEVHLADQVFKIAARAYSVAQVRAMLERYFQIQTLVTYPVISALMPNEVLRIPRMREFCGSADALFATHPTLSVGPYILAVVRNGEPATAEQPLVGYPRIMELIEHHQVHWDVREHGPVYTMKDVQTALPDVPPGQMLKAVVTVAARGAGAAPQLCVAVVPATRRVDFPRLAAALGLQEGDVSSAPPDLVLQVTGFRPGAIPPFGFPAHVTVVVDRSVEQLEHVWCGTGRATESLRLTVADLRKLSAYAALDIAA